VIVTAIILAIIAALVDYFFGIPEPWRKIIWVGIVILLIIGIVLLLVPGLFSHLGRY
jgi:membrane protein YdbS with pleckstrin-like domain